MDIVNFSLKVLVEGSGVEKTNLRKGHFPEPLRYIFTKERLETMNGFTSYGIESLYNIKFLTTCRTRGKIELAIRSELRFRPLVDAWMAVVVAAVIQLDRMKLCFEAYVTLKGR